MLLSDNDNERVTQFRAIDQKTWDWATESVMRYKGRMSPQKVLREICRVYEAILRGEDV